MIRPSLAGLVDQYHLPDAALLQLQVLLDRLVRDPLAPTTVREPEAVVRDHLADSLVALELPVVAAARAVADLGSGAGLPGLPLAIALPEARVALVESTRRKCEFLQAVVDAAGLANVEVVCERAETWTSGRARHDLVTARALARLSVVAEYAAPLLQVGGSLVAWRGQRDAEVEAEADVAARILGMSDQIVVAVQPYPEAEHRHLHLMSKVTATPERFPRRPGVAAKRPLR